MLISAKEILTKARREGYGVPALAVNNEHNLRAAIEAADEKNSPVILLCMYKGSPDFVQFGRMAAEIAGKTSVPVATILDHGADFNEAVWAVKAGLTDIMIDKSTLPYEENAAQVKEVVKMAHAVGMGVEAELGHVGSGENYAQDGHTAFTVPEEAVRYVEETGVDLLAVAVGTAHGVYKGTPELQFELLKELREKLSVPLVLHGGSGTGEENIAKACRLGITKVNLANDMYRASAEALAAEDLSGNAVYNLYGFLAARYKKAAKHYMDVTDSAGKGGKTGCESALGKSEDANSAEA